MFEKINYAALTVLIIILAVMIVRDGKAKWKESPGVDFYKMSTLTNTSEKEKNEIIKKKYGKIEELITAEKLDEAMLSLKQMEPTSKDDAHLYFMQGRIYAKMKLYKESLTALLKAVKYDPDYVDAGCLIYKGTMIKEITLDAMEYYKDKNDEASKDATKLIYSMQRRLAGSCE